MAGIPKRYRPRSLTYVDFRQKNADTRMHCRGGRVSARLDVGDRAPEFDLPDVSGGRVQLDAAAASATVVVFTANGCPFALAWHDRIQDVARDYAPADVAVLQVLSNDDSTHPEDSVERMRERVEAGEFVGPFLHDPTQSVAQAYGAVATPEVFVLDSAGVLRYHGAPDCDHDDPGQRAGWLRAALDAVLAGAAVGTERTSPAGCSIKWRVELLWWDGCPTHDLAADRLERVLTEMGRQDVHVVKRRVVTQAEADELKFPGSPTFQVGGVDLFPTASAPALGCRVYTTREGRPTPLPEEPSLSSVLRERLARPWDLPGWVDPRKREPEQTPLEESTEGTRR